MVIDSSRPNNLGSKTGKIPGDKKINLLIVKNTLPNFKASPKMGRQMRPPNHTDMTFHFECFKGNMNMSICVPILHTMFSIKILASMHIQ